MISFTSSKKQKLSKAICDADFGLSYSVLFKLLRKKDVKVNGKRVKEDVLLNNDDKVEIFYSPVKTEKFSTVFSDDNIVIINKKSGFTSESVFEDLKEKYDGAGFIHRLDRNTSGLMVFSLNPATESALLKGFKNRDFIKYYTAEVIGKMPKKENVMIAFLVKDPVTSTVKIYGEKKPDAVLIKTGYSVIEEKKDTSVLKVRLYTGKTHQIRAHLAYIGHAIVGDGKYGDKEFNKSVGAKRQLLSASEIIFSFPKDSPLYYLDKKSFCTE